MQYVKSKYSTAQNSEWKTEIFGVLEGADRNEPMNREEIQRSSLVLINVTPQKISKLLSEMAESGFISRVKRGDGKIGYRVVEF